MTIGLSPDAGRYFAYMPGPSGGLSLGEVKAGNDTHPAPAVTGSVTFDRMGHFTTPAFAWSSDSRSVWGVTQDRVVPNGWAISELRPVRITVNGSITALPPLRHPAGTLDQISWVGGGGLALAQFGTRGDYYRPQKANPTPTVAMVDAARGVVLQSMLIAAFPGAGASPLPTFALNDGVGVVRRDGRMVVVFIVRRTLVRWVQGETPRVVGALADDQQINGFALSSDGSRLLLGRLLMPNGMMCEHNPNCPPPKPNTGLIATFHNLDTGRVVWERRATARAFNDLAPPAISPDGQFGIIGLPPEKGIAAQLVDLKTGRDVEPLPAPCPCGFTSGFLPDAKTLWLQGYVGLALYRRG